MHICYIRSEVSFYLAQMWWNKLCRETFEWGIYSWYSFVHGKSWKEKWLPLILRAFKHNYSKTPFIWLQLVIPKVRYSEGSVIPKVCYSEGSLIRNRNRVRYSEGSFLEGSLIRKRNQVRYSKGSLFRKRNRVR